MFLLNLNYLRGDWLLREELFAVSKKPDRKRMSPLMSGKKPLHSVPVVRISMNSIAPKKPTIVPLLLQ